MEVSRPAWARIKCWAVAPGEERFTEKTSAAIWYPWCLHPASPWEALLCTGGCAECIKGHGVAEMPPCAWQRVPGCVSSKLRS